MDNFDNIEEIIVLEDINKVNEALKNKHKLLKLYTTSPNLEEAPNHQIIHFVLGRIRKSASEIYCEKNNISFEERQKSLSDFLKQED
ncbi:hypothetical protein LIY46_09625 [Fusobacterium varium]|uniref:hypothetical protein n=1 Tax=Fusobacterium TaxID=848 RepID=UPI0030CBD8F9